MCKDSWGVIVAESNGLLDFLNSPGGMGLLSAVGSGLAGARRGGRWNALGSGLLGGVQGFAQGQELQRQNEYATQRGKLFDMQAQQLEQQQAAAKAEAERKAAREGYLSTVGKVTSPVIGAQPNAFDPLKWRAMGGSMDEAETIRSALSPKPISVKEGETLIDPRTHKPVFSAPGSSDSKIKQFEYAKANGYTGSFEQFVTLGPALMAAASAPLRQAQIDATTAATGYNYPKPAPRASSSVTVTTPDGQVFSFPNQQAANSFKMKAGIK